ncbi:sporulation YhaL family protein [Bacillus salitolerans]|uniref:Sporulation YhaL family protein n=1 Tax=Bacillus salitolerans TaxID=1437434 RepID=A0ABW4LVE7_9BACI
MITIPWWIYLVVTGIVFSGVMMVKTSKRDREMQQFYIEREGQVFMERMKYEKEKRQQQDQAEEVTIAQ